MSCGRALRAGALAAALFLGAPGPAGAGDHPGPDGADELVARVLDAYGGLEALAGVAAYRMEGTVSAAMRKSAGDMVRTFARPARLRVELNYPTEPETRILDGRQGWRTDTSGKTGPVEGMLLGSMVLQAARANLPWLLDERRGGLTLLPPMDGGRTAGLELALGEGLSLTVYVDAATGRIFRSTGILAEGGTKTAFTAEYSDFRPVEGVLFAFRERTWAAGMPTGETVISKVTLNPPLGPDAFRP